MCGCLERHVVSLMEQERILNVNRAADVDVQGPGNFARFEFYCNDQ